MINAAMHVGYSRRQGNEPHGYLPCHPPALRSSDRHGQPWKLTWCAGSLAVRGNAVTAVNELPNEHDIIYPPGSLETVMEASLCPICSRALKISTIEPHPT